MIPLKAERAHKAAAINKLLCIAHEHSSRGQRWGCVRGHPEKDGLACLSEELRLLIRGSTFKSLALAYARAEGLDSDDIPDLDEFSPTDASDGWAGVHDSLTEALASIARIKSRGSLGGQV